jgi:hypothetical protein
LKSAKQNEASIPTHCACTKGLHIYLYENNKKSINVMEICDNTGFVPDDATIVGNTCLYGARGGQVFVSGKAGERFAVRNYLGHTVVEGIVDNCCEYMTRGCVVVPNKYNLLFLIVRRIMCLCIKEENRHQALHMHFFVLLVASFSLIPYAYSSSTEL